MDMFLVPIAYTHMCVYRRLLTPSGNMFDTGQKTGKCCHNRGTDKSEFRNVCLECELVAEAHRYVDTGEKRGTLSSAFTKGECTHRRRGSAVVTGDIRITDPKSSADLNIVMDPQPSQGVS
jgi:hypothetical protein